MPGETSMVIMFISKFLRRRGDFMKLEEIIEKSKEICENQTEKGCSQCPIVEFTCFDLNGHLSGNAEGLIKLRDYLEAQESKKGSQPKGNQPKEAKGKGKK